MNEDDLLEQWDTIPEEFTPYTADRKEDAAHITILKPHRKLELTSIIGAYLHRVTALSPNTPKVEAIIAKHIKLLVDDLQDNYRRANR
jgi:hypothetical protein